MLTAHTRHRDHADVSHGTNRRVVQNLGQVTAGAREAHSVHIGQSEASAVPILTNQRPGVSLSPSQEPDTAFSPDPA